MPDNVDSMCTCVNVNGGICVWFPCTAWWEHTGTVSFVWELIQIISTWVKPATVSSAPRSSALFSLWLLLSWALLDVLVELALLCDVTIQTLYALLPLKCSIVLKVGVKQSTLTWKIDPTMIHSVLVNYIISARPSVCFSRLRQRLCYTNQKGWLITLRSS